jgi:hypothetical protein
MKKYLILILMQSGTTQQWMEEELEASDFHSSERGYYYFKVDGKSRYYPINNTIIKEL